MELSEPFALSDLIGKPVYDGSGRRLGRAFELLAHWEQGGVVVDEVLFGRGSILKRLRLSANTFTFEPELTCRLAQWGARIYEVPISYEGRTYEEGKKIRAKVLGAGREKEIAQTEDDFSMPLREFSTRYVWGELWSRKGLPLKTRSLINVALLTALGVPAWVAGTIGAVDGEASARLVGSYT